MALAWEIVVIAFVVGVLGIAGYALGHMLNVGRHTPQH